MTGGLAPTLGLAVARARLAEDEEVSLDPLPARLRVRTVIAWAVTAVVALAVVVRSPAISLAHVGGLLAGYCYFRLRGVPRRPTAAAALPIRRAVMTPVRLEVQESSAVTPTTTPSPPSPVAPTPPHTGPTEANELDRLLDKISATGLESLTTQERRRLAEYADRKRKEGS
jgi:hypothetical protein